MKKQFILFLLINSVLGYATASYAENNSSSSNNAQVSETDEGITKEDNGDDEPECD